MNRRLVLFFGLIGLTAALSVPASPQDRDSVRSAAGDLYVISAKAGGVNYVEGNVTTIRADGTAGRVVKGDKMEAGDVILTGDSARAELLLNPGSYARLDRSSEFELVTTNLDDLKLKVRKGSAIFEVFASDDFRVTVNTPLSEFYLIESGVYRVDVAENGVARLEVWRGKAETKDDADSTLKKGRTATLDGGDVSVAKFDRGSRDEFEEWSRDRAELIAKANKKFETKMLGRSLLDTFRSDAWDCWQSVGLWVYSRRYNVYSFVPFGYGWRSPYGIGYRTNTGICYNPGFYYGRPYRRIYGNYPKGGGTRTGDTTPTRTTVPQENVDRGRRAVTPPFQRMQRSGSVKTNRPVIIATPGIRTRQSSGSNLPPAMTKPAEPTSKGKDN